MNNRMYFNVSFKENKYIMKYLYNNIEYCRCFGIIIPCQVIPQKQTTQLNIDEICVQNNYQKVLLLSIIPA